MTHFFSELVYSSSLLLPVLKLIPLATFFLVAFQPAWKVNFIRKTSLNASLLTFFLSLAVYAMFDPCCADFQMTYNLQAPASAFLFNLSFAFGVDGLNIWLVMLTTFLTPLCLLVGWHIPASLEIRGPEFLKSYALIFLALEVILLIAFVSLLL